MQSQNKPVESEQDRRIRRRKQMIFAGKVLTTVAVTAAVFAAVRARPGATAIESVVSEPTTPQNLVAVSKHLKMQAHGPAYSLHRPREIESYVRRAASAA